MSSLNTARWFAGRDSNDAGVLPDWYRTQRQNSLPDDAAYDHGGTLHGLMRDLPSVETRPVAFYDDEADEWVETERGMALVNPDWLDDQTPTQGPFTPGDACWHIPTSDYSPVKPNNLFGPLGALLRQDRYEDLLGDSDTYDGVFGEARCYRNGGEVHLDIFFDGVRVTDPFGSDAAQSTAPPFTLGLQVGYDFYGGRAIYAEVIAYDTRSGAVHRGLTGSHRRKHVGKAQQDVADWWETLLDSFEKASELLTQSIADANNYEVELDQLPGISLEEYLSATGLPEYLAESAADSLPGTIHREQRNPTAWELYDAGMTALTHDFDGKDGGSLRHHTTTVTDFLFAPEDVDAATTEECVYIVRNKSSGLSNGMSITEAADEIEQRSIDIEQAKADHRTHRQRLTDLFETVQSDDDEDASNGTGSGNGNGTGNSEAARADGGYTLSDFDGSDGDETETR